ncbi:hypothetical protein [Bradyrhizobium sp. 172]|uniref:hypothetical protein n=1 Tax=Bradyrhizobium sp. 172 TaxID=2782643 RepID=UPI001FFFF9E0|nr:hypothetical protein [Bradyrhizobium sp. 172]UPK00029.1 hypothetical protein IVB07_39285 [Bradyrhizobium sp. 172]
MATKPIDNERRACDAVAKVLEERFAARRANATSPEDNRVGPPVEYVFELTGETYALEHTVVEAFVRQIHKDVDFDAFAAPIARALDRQMPSPGSYRLTFAIHPSKGLKPKRIAQVQAAIVAWVRASAAAMHAECPEVPTRGRRPHGHESVRRATVEGVDLHLHREIGWSLPEAAYGRVFCGRFAPPSYETLRVERMRAALAKKLPKLQSWKDSGARSVLVLENRDRSLSNHVVILEAAEEALEARDDAPDEIWLVDTTIRTEWTVWCLMRDGLSFPDEETPFRFREFRPEDLVHVGAV